MPIDILFLSNGHGEDHLAVRIAQELDDIAIAGFPLVGAGEAYRTAGIPLLGPRHVMPSGGFVLRDARALRTDLAAGLGRLLIDQVRFLAGLAAPGLVVAVGDMLPVAASLLIDAPRAFVGCNKSDHYQSWGSAYMAPEIALLKWAGMQVYPRDLRTHERLIRLGVDSCALGNPMMDDLDPRWPGEEGVLGVLPGSRQDAFENLAAILPCLEALGTQIAFEALLAAPGSLDPAGWERVAAAAGWEVTSEAFRKGRVVLRRGLAFREVLRRSQVVLGLAGTANEQAVGCGRPVVAFPGKGTQYTRRFAQLQAELLGPGLRVVEGDPEIVASELARAFEADRRGAARIAGADRMGDPGAAARIARDLVRKIGEKPKVRLSN